VTEKLLQNHRNLRRSSSDHTNDATRWLLRSDAGGRYRSTSAKAAADQHHVAAAIDRRDRQTDRQTDGHETDVLRLQLDVAKS